ARRGVTLSVAAVLSGAKAAAGPDSLLTRTCGLVADWAAGAVVPAAGLRLGPGGDSMRGVGLGGLLALALGGRGALARRAGGPPRARARAPPPPPPPPPAPTARTDRRRRTRRRGTAEGGACEGPRPQVEQDSRPRAPCRVGRGVEPRRRVAGRHRDGARVP